jgi:DNA-binding transcriptional MocR family regulator
MSPGATFERVYRALKEQLASGRFRPGEPLEPRTLSDALNASITPVRDALHRLVGERLVEAPRGTGFRMPLLTEVGLRHLYAWNEALLLLGAAGPRGSVSGTLDTGALADPLHELEALFLAIAGRTGNPEHVEAVARLSARLRPIRAVEEMVIGPSAPERAQLQGDLELDNRPAMRRALRAYHRRRGRAAALLVAELVGQ